MNGPNLNMLGLREPGIYGNLTLADIETRLHREAEKMGVALDFFTSNHEHALIERLRQAAGCADGVVLNAGGYTHTSPALARAVADAGIPVMEAHISNVHAREAFRHTSYLSPVCAGVICGLGWRSYLCALQALCMLGERLA
ncbi:MAG: type II 3-dehydroquinate dehydratase [Oscillospiraceae bacterium]|jgi:3-dehydroquinate dehydratase-2|nr:type II 3-dehydroquinate dehydratase [Oscillospiraceae bacterium]